MMATRRRPGVNELDCSELPARSPHCPKAGDLAATRTTSGQESKSPRATSRGPFSTSSVTTCVTIMPEAGISGQALVRKNYGVERTGIEPATPCLQSRCSPS